MLRGKAQATHTPRSGLGAFLKKTAEYLYVDKEFEKPYKKLLKWVRHVQLGNFPETYVSNIFLAEFFERTNTGHWIIIPKVGALI